MEINLPRRDALDRSKSTDSKNQKESKMIKFDQLDGLYNSESNYKTPFTEMMFFKHLYFIDAYLSPVSPCSLLALSTLK